MANELPIEIEMDNGDADPSADLDLRNFCQALVAEACVIDEKRLVNKAEMFQAFRSWMRSRGRKKCGGRVSFNRELIHVFPAVATTILAGRPFFTGIALRTERIPR